MAHCDKSSQRQHANTTQHKTAASLYERDQKLRAAYKLENHAQNQVDKAKENLKDAQYRLFNEGDDNKDLSVCDAVTAATRDVLAAR
jgi:hypothetical protein